MMFAILNTVACSLVTVVVVYKLTQFREALNMVERLGLGMMGACSFMVITVVWDPHSPFQGWAFLLANVGALLLLGGRTYRDLKHQWANDAANLQAANHLKSRGKL